MTASVRYQPEAVSGYRLEQLAAAFDRVMNPRDWKAPIRAVIPAEEWHVVEQAVLWFTETVPAFEAVPGQPHHLLITAPGYRLGAASRRNGSPAASAWDGTGIPEQKENLCVSSFSLES